MDVFQALLKTMPGLKQGQWRNRLTRKKSSERKMISSRAPDDVY
jgi:hypothetical protein